MVHAGESLAGTVESVSPKQLRDLLAEFADSPDKLLQFGNELYKNGHRYEAEIALIQALRSSGSLDPDAISQARRTLDAIYSDDTVLEIMRERNEFSSLERLYTHRIEANPVQAANNYAQRGLVRQRLLKLEEALADMQTAQSMGLSQPDLRAKVQRESYTLRGAIAQLQKDRKMQEQRKLQRGDDQETSADPSIGSQDETLDSSQELRRRYITDRIRGLIQGANWDGLDAYLEELTANTTTRSHAALQRGYLRIAMGDKDGADDSLNLALRSGPDETGRLEALRALFWIDRIKPEHGDIPEQARIDASAILDSEIDMVRLPTLPWLTAWDKQELADSLRSEGEWNLLALAQGQLRQYAMDPAMRGKFLYNQAELNWATGNKDAAYEQYLEARASLAYDNYLRSGIHFRLAEYHNEKGDQEQAKEELLLAAAEFSTNAWILQQAGKSLVRMGVYDAGFEQLQHALELVSRPTARADIFSAYIDAYDKLRDQDKFVEYAGKYIDEVAAAESASAWHKGNAALYQGRIFDIRGEREQGYASYLRALELLTEKYQVADTYMRMAENALAGGDPALARDNAEKSLAQLPDQEWKINQVSGFIARLDRLEQSEQQAGPTIEPLPEKTSDPLRQLAAQAEKHKKAKDQKSFIELARQYVHQAASAERELDDAEQGLLEYYRGEILSHDNDTDSAYAAYGAAADLLTDKYRLAEISMKLARIDILRGRRESAAAHARHSAELVPNQAWKLREVGDFLARLGLGNEAANYLRQAGQMDASSESAGKSYLSLAEAYKASGDQDEYLRNARLYIESLHAEGVTPTEAEAGAAALYQGEILFAEGKFNEAYAAYAQASRTETDPYRLAEIHMNMAEASRKNEDLELAYENAVQSAELLPDRVWKLRQVGNFLLGIDRPVEGSDYLLRSLDLSASPEHDAATYAALAQAFKKSGDTEKYLEYAREYVQSVALKNGDASDRDEGQRAYYQAEIYAAEGRADEAYREYAIASGLITEKYRLSDIFTRMAEYERGAGKRDQAIASMRKSADVLPEQIWKQEQALQFFLGNDMLDEAEEYSERLFRLDPDSRRKFSVYGALAEAFARHDNQEKQHEYLLKQGDVAIPGEDATDENEGLRAYYQARLLAAQGDADAAYREYERASTLITEDKIRLAEAFSRMARHQAEQGNREIAADNVRKAAALFPEDAQRQVQAGNAMLRQGMPDAAVEFFERAIVLNPDPELKIASYRTLADGFKRIRDQDKFAEYARRFGEAISADGRSASDEEKGRLALYEADMHAAAGDEAKAFAARQQASTLIHDERTLSDLHAAMADYLAKTGRREESIRHMELSLQSMRTVPWKLREAGNLYLRMDMPEKAIECFEMSLENSTTLADRSASYKSLSEVHQRLANDNRYIFYLEKYIECLNELVAGRGFFREEQGRLHFYRGELHRARGEPAAAYHEYVEASGLLRDVYALSETYLNIARYFAEHLGDTQQAETAMDTSVSYIPHASWKLSQAGAFFDRLGKTDKALEHYHQAIEHSRLPLEQAANYRAIAEIYNRLGDREKFAEYARKFLDIMTRESESRQLSDSEMAYSAYFQAAMHTLEGEDDLAFREYQHVVSLSRDPRHVAEAYWRMAQYYFDRKDDRERAAEMMDASAAQLPGQAWKLQQAGDFFMRLGMKPRALSYYQQALTAATTPAIQATAYRSLADYYSRENDDEQFLHHARMYLETLPSDRERLSENEAALAHYYQAEVYAKENRPDLALSEYQLQVENSTDTVRTADAYLKMAEIYAKRQNGDENANRDAAVYYANASADMLPDSVTRQRDVGTFFGRIDMFERQMQLYDRALAVAKSARERADIYTHIADAHFRHKDSPKEVYLHFASLYVHSVAEMGESASNAEKGLSAFYQGEILSNQLSGETAAYYFYEQSTFLLEDKYRRTDALLKMARYNARNKREDLAAAQAWEVADTLPDVGYRVSPAADILSSIKRYTDAITILNRAIRARPVDNVDLNRDVARMYNSLKDRKTAAAYNAVYIDHMTDKVARTGAYTEKRQLDDLWQARRTQNRYTRSRLRFESYLWGSRNAIDQENVGTSHKLSYYYSFLGMYGSVYGSLGWTLYGNYSGYYYNEYSDSMQQWNSNPRMKDSLHYRIGANIHPFSRTQYRWLHPLSIGVEYMHGLWRNDEHDFLIKVEYERSKGLEPRPYGKFWKYRRDKFEGAYSTQERDFTSVTSFRRGVVIPARWDRNLLFIPHGDVRLIQTGSHEDKQFLGVDAGPSLQMRKYFREDKYHAPRSYVDLQLYYRWGLTKDRHNSYGFSMSLSF